MNYKYKKILILFSLSLILFLEVFPGLVNAAVPAVPAVVGATILGFLKVIATTASKIYLSVLAILYFIGYLVAALFSLGAYLVDLALKMNSLILKSPVLLNGWEMTLNFANLGLILGIIIIAFATIFRVQNYAMKQILWKLIVVALLVNFSLVIAGAFISVSDIISNYFLSRVSNVYVVAGNFADNLAAVMNPQKFLTIEETKGFWATTAEEIKSIFNAGDVVKSAGSLFFVIIFTFLGALTFLSLAIMLFIRYVALIILLILSPLVWLFWIFPATSSHWNKWWTEFIRWTFFAPAVLFFLALVFEGMELYKKQILDASAFSSAGSAIGSIIITQNAPAVIGQMVIFIALIFGGIYTANKMGITFAATSINWAKGTGKMFGGWIGRKSIQAGTLPLRGEWGRKAIEGMQGMGLSRNRFVRALASPIRNLGGLASRGGIRQGEKLVKEAEKRSGGWSDKQGALALSTMSGEGRAYWLPRLAKNKNLDMVPGGVNRYIKDKNTKKVFESYGKGKDYNDVEFTHGADTAALNAKTPEERMEAMKNFEERHSSRDHDKMAGNIFSAYNEKTNNIGLSAQEHEEFRKIKSDLIFDTHPGAISKVRVLLKGKNLLEFQNSLDQFIEKFEDTIKMPQNIRGPKVPVVNKINFIEDQNSYQGISGVKSHPYLGNWSRGLYNARKNFAGTLLGSTFVSSEEPTASTPPTPSTSPPGP